jgi:hypothetical protein
VAFFAGLKLVGNRNSVTEALLEDMTWLGSLDFPPLELGFGFANPTTTAAAAAVSSSSDEHAGTAASASASASAETRAEAEAEAEAEADDEMEQIPHTPWGGVRQQDHRHLGGVDPTLGNDNTVTRATLRRFGKENDNADIKTDIKTGSHEK